MSYIWVCKGCLIGAGADPDKVTESCIGRFGKETCGICGHVQDVSWFKHMQPRDLPPVLQEKLEDLEEEERAYHDAQMLYPEDYGGEGA